MIALSEPIFSEEEKNSLVKVIESGWLTMGERVKQFESDFATLHHYHDAVAVNSCTAGLHLGLAALDIGPGDEVIVPSLTFVSAVNSVLFVGATPVFADIASISQPHISIESAQGLVSEKTRAVMIMHYGGYLADMVAWREFADVNGLFLIEDAAHAPGCESVGLHSDACAFSFFSNKNMTTSEGGMLYLKDPARVATARSLRSHGMTSLTLDRHKGHAYSYDVNMLGYNYRLDELRGALGSVQLKNLKQWNAARKNFSDYYRELISEQCPQVQIPFSEHADSAAHLLPVILPNGTDRKAVMDHLRENSIQSSIHYPPSHKFSFYQQHFPDVELPMTEEFCQRELSLPLHPSLQSSDINKVVQTLSKAI